MVNNPWYNKKAGGIGLAIIIVLMYVSIKIAKFGFEYSVLWSSGWFIAIIITALAADLFENIETWIYNNMVIIEKKGLTPGERITMIKTQLDSAVDRYMALFLLVNGFDNFLKKAWNNIIKIGKGIITIKEAILILSYAMYDLVVRDGALSFMYPYDTLVIFTGFIGLKIINAETGVAGIITAMYKEIEDIKDINKTLKSITDYIKELAHMYHIEISIPQEDQVVTLNARIADLKAQIKSL